VTGPLVLLGSELGPPTPAAAIAHLHGPAVVLPTASAFEHPHRLAATVIDWLVAHDVAAVEVAVLNRRDATATELIGAVASAATIVITGGTAMHARSVFKESPLWSALLDAHRRGAAVIASGAGATVLADPMADSRGGGLTLGLGLIGPVAVMAGSVGWPGPQIKRMRQLAGERVVVATIGDGGALIYDGSTWTTVGEVELHRGGANVELTALPAPASRD
jgi:cyanophycinase